jgi:hypothetical protein
MFGTTLAQFLASERFPPGAAMLLVGAYTGFVTGFVVLSRKLRVNNLGMDDYIREHKSMFIGTTLGLLTALPVAFVVELGGRLRSPDIFLLSTLETLSIVVLRPIYNNGVSPNALHAIRLSCNIWWLAQHK